MKVKKIESNDDIFSSFLIKEQELDYIEEKHAKACIMQLAKEYKQHEETSTIITKIKDYIQDCKDNYKFKKIKKESEYKISQLSDKEKCDKMIEHKSYEHGDFKTHIFFEQKYTQKNIIANCGTYHYPIIEYKVYIRIEYTTPEIWTRKYLKESFESYENALEYYDNLKSNYRHKNCIKILNDLTEKIDNHCKELNKRITNFGY